MADWDDAFNNMDSILDKHQQDWGIGNNGWKNVERDIQVERERRMERERIEREARRMREEMARRAEERARERDRQEQVDEDDHHLHAYQRHILDAMKSAVGTKSKKQIAIDKLAIKFCFIRNRLSVWKTLGALGVIKNPFEKKNEAELLRNVFESVITAAARNGISKKEILESIMKLSAEVSEGDMAELFVNNYLGVIALNVFKTNPNIIKDVKPKSTGPKIKPTTIQDFHRELTTEEIMRMLDNVNGGRHRINTDDLFIMDYPEYIGGREIDREPTTINTWLEHLRRRLE